MEIEQLIRENIKRLQPYSCARDEYQGKQAVFLDANENPYDNGYNRYPDPRQLELKERLAGLKGVAAGQMMLGNGSDEIIDLMIRCFCEPARDNLIVFSPGYVMYEVSAAVNNVEVRKINLTTDFLPDWEEMWRQVDRNTRLIFLCTPNNPTGKVVPLKLIEQLCREFSGIVLVDEAYIDFTDKPSATSLLQEYQNVVVLQTLSKAWGMAGLRLGICMAVPEVTEVLNRVKSPYNISGLTQRTVLDVLSREEDFRQKRDAVKNERERLVKELRKIRLFSQVYDSEANFILVTSEVFRDIYRYLVECQIVVRLRDIPPLIPGGIRITVGTREENDHLLEVLYNYYNIR